MGNGYIPSRFFLLFKHGMINIHHEILPDFPGAQSIIWPLIKGRKETGFSIHQITKGIDKGALLIVKKRPIVFYSSLMSTIKKNYHESLVLSLDSLINLLKVPFHKWNFKPNLATQNYTTPTFLEWMRAFLNYRKFKNHES
jgi:methionyl-tRNA formyltransferase